MGWGVFAGSLAETGMKTYTDLEENSRANAKMKLAQNADDRAAKAAERDQGRYDREVRAEQEVRDAAAFKPGAINDKGASAALETAAAPAAKGIPAPNTKTAASEPVTEVAAAEPATPRAALPTAGKPATGAALSRLETARQAYETLRTPAALSMLREAEKDNLAQREASRLEQESAVRRRATEQAMTHADYEFSRKQYTDVMKGAAGVAAQLDKIPDPKTSVLDPSARQTVRDLATQMVEASKYTPDGKSYGFEEIEGGLKLYEVDDKTGKRLKTERVYSTVGDIREAFTAASALAEPGVMEQYGLANGLQKMMTDAPALRADYLKIQNIVKDRKNLADPETKQEAIELAHQIALKDPTVEEVVETPLLDDKGEPVRDDNGKIKTVKSVQNKLIRQIEAASPRTSMPQVNDKGVVKMLPAQAVVEQWSLRVPDALPKYQYNQDLMRSQMLSDLTSQGWEPVVANWIADKAITKATAQAQATMSQAGEKLKAQAMPRSAVPYNGVAYDNVQ